MNELIKRLAQEAGFDLDVHGSNDGNFYGYEGRWINQEITQFAKLVAEHCAQMVLDLERVYPANLTVREIKKEFDIG